MNMTADEMLRTPRPTLPTPGSWLGMGRRLVAGVVGSVVAWGTRPVEEVDSYSGPEWEGPDPLAFDLLSSEAFAADHRLAAAGTADVRTAELAQANGRR
jgi:hypothetical protein